MGLERYVMLVGCTLQSLRSGNSSPLIRFRQRQDPEELLKRYKGEQEQLNFWGTHEKRWLLKLEKL